MKHRAIKDLNQLTDNDFFHEVSVGLAKIHENCIELDKSFKLLVENKNYRASRIIEAVSKEEAAKYLILIDALRCPRKKHKEITRQLAKFNDHMAKGVYAELCDWRPSTYDELVKYIKNSLEEYYLDGPLGVDWIFRNSIISNREEAFYVDYVENDDHHKWLTPQSRDSLNNIISVNSSSAVINIVKAIHAIGLAEYEAIKEFSLFWRSFEFTDVTHYTEFRKANLDCLNVLDKKNILKEALDEDYGLVINNLPFPLYKEDMKEIKISREALKEIQNNWCG